MPLGCTVVFFFQAEDGIRDLVRSRGLGDVYKRQERTRDPVLLPHPGLARRIEALARQVDARLLVLDPVSYTHLTLPTIYSV